MKKRKDIRAGVFKLQRSSTEERAETNEKLRKEGGTSGECVISQKPRKKSVREGVTRCTEYLREIY